MIDPHLKEGKFFFRQIINKGLFDCKFSIGIDFCNFSDLAFGIVEIDLDEISDIKLFQEFGSRTGYSFRFKFT